MGEVGKLMLVLMALLCPTRALSAITNASISNATRWKTSIDFAIGIISAVAIMSAIGTRINRRRHAYPFRFRAIVQGFDVDCMQTFWPFGGIV